MNGRPEVSFGIMADCQSANVPDEVIRVPDFARDFKNYYRLSPQKLREAVNKLNGFHREHHLDFAVHLGDYIDRDLRDTDELNRITDGLLVPLYHVLGNHEFEDPKAKGNVGLVLGKLGMRSAYYSERINGYRFAFLDTTEIGLLQHPEGTREWMEGMRAHQKAKARGAIQTYVANGALSDTQLAWLDNELTEAEAAGEEAVLFSHHPVFPTSWLNALNDNEILETIDRHDNVVAFINGHDHIGRFGVRNGIPYITMQAMINGEDNAFGIGHLYRDRLRIDGYGRVPDMEIQKRV